MTCYSPFWRSHFIQDIIQFLILRKPLWPVPIVLQALGNWFYKTPNNESKNFLWCICSTESCEASQFCIPNLKWKIFPFIHSLEDTSLRWRRQRQRWFKSQSSKFPPLWHLHQFKAPCVASCWGLMWENWHKTRTGLDIRMKNEIPSSKFYEALKVGRSVNAEIHIDFKDKSSFHLEEADVPSDRDLYDLDVTTTTALWLQLHPELPPHPNQCLSVNLPHFSPLSITSACGNNS